MRLFANSLIKTLTILFCMLPFQAQAQTSLSEAQLQTVQNINDYLNSFNTATSLFEQIGPNGERITGKMLMQRPGKIRFEYDAPAKLLIVSNGDWIGIENKKAKTMERYPLSRTPLKFLLAQNINLGQDARILDVFNEGDFSTITLEATDDKVDGKLTLIFEGAPLQLKRWIVTDAQGYDITVNLGDINFGSKINKKMFFIPDNDLMINPR